MQPSRRTGLREAGSSELPCVRRSLIGQDHRLRHVKSPAGSERRADPQNRCDRQTCVKVNRLMSFGRLNPFGTPFAVGNMERTARRAMRREWPREGSGIDRPQIVGSGVVIEISTQVINHAEGQT
jgi:hypothetical protein